MTELEPAIENLSRDLVAALEVFEEAQRNFFPGIVPQLREAFPPFFNRLTESRQAIASVSLPSDREALGKTLTDASDLCLKALDLSKKTNGVEQFLIDFRKSTRRIHRAFEMLYPLHALLPAVNRFFLEEALHGRAGEFIASSNLLLTAGLMHVGLDEDPYARGGYSLYIPESWNGSEPLPLVVALHGGFSHGRDFIWTWLREARSRQFVLASPSSLGITWTIMGHDFDSVHLYDMLDHISKRWNIDTKRMLLTGLSDGATYAFVRAMDEESPFAAYAVVSGILPPFDPSHMKGRRLLWVHGARDWMFPLWRVKTGEKQLQEVGADITLRVIPDLYHAYPREQNGAILTWFDPLLTPHVPET